MSNPELNLPPLCDTQLKRFRKGHIYEGAFCELMDLDDFAVVDNSSNKASGTAKDWKSDEVVQTLIFLRSALAGRGHTVLPTNIEVFSSGNSGTSLRNTLEYYKNENAQALADVSIREIDQSSVMLPRYIFGPDFMDDFSSSYSRMIVKSLLQKNIGTPEPDNIFVPVGSGETARGIMLGGIYASVYKTFKEEGLDPNEAFLSTYCGEDGRLLLEQTDFKIAREKWKFNEDKLRRNMPTIYLVSKEGFFLSYVEKSDGGWVLKEGLEEKDGVLSLPLVSSGISKLETSRIPKHSANALVSAVNLYPGKVERVLLESEPHHFSWWLNSFVDVEPSAAFAFEALRDAKPSGYSWVVNTGLGFTHPRNILSHFDRKVIEERFMVKKPSRLLTHVSVTKDAMPEKELALFEALDSMKDKGLWGEYWAAYKDNILAYVSVQNLPPHLAYRMTSFFEGVDVGREWFYMGDTKLGFSMMAALIHLKEFCDAALWKMLFGLAQCPQGRGNYMMDWQYIRYATKEMNEDPIKSAIAKCY